MKLFFRNTTFVFGFVGLLILSWIFIHVLALLGIFLAFLYPLWWVLLPKYNLCLMCRVRTEGSWCPLCKQKVTHVSGQHIPYLSSALINSSIVMVFALVSIGLVFLESKTLTSSGILPPPSTITFAIPDKNKYGLGEIFPLKLQINNIETPINVVQADIAFDPSKLEVVDVSTKDSFASIFIQKEIDNERGFARLTGGLPNPGYQKNSGLFGTVYFKAKAVGPVTVKFLPSTLALANDGRGTNVLKNVSDVSYLIVPQKISITSLSKVLGAATEKGTNGTQMIFYDDNSVLAADTSAAKDKVQLQNAQKGVGWVIVSLNELAGFDKLVFSFWSKFF